MGRGYQDDIDKMAWYRLCEITRGNLHQKSELQSLSDSRVVHKRADLRKNISGALRPSMRMESNGTRVNGESYHINDVAGIKMGKHLLCPQCFFVRDVLGEIWGTQIGTRWWKEARVDFEPVQVLIRIM
jgi:hypothetical protein